MTVKNYRFGLFSLVTLAASSAHASWNEIDLNPVSSAGSGVNAVFGNMQGGFAELSGIGNGSAGIWTGSASSWVDLAPAAATSSSVVAISGATGAGVAVYGRTANEIARGRCETKATYSARRMQGRSWNILTFHDNSRYFTLDDKPASGAHESLLASSTHEKFANAA